MALTKAERKAFVAPALIALILIGASGYNWHLSSQAKLLQEMIAKTNAQIREGRSTLQSLEELDEKEMFRLQYKLDVWVPVFQNPVEVRLYLTQKVQAALSSVGASENGWEFIPPESTNKPYLCKFHVDALFPSYAALLQFIREMENNPPPLLPQELGIQKEGIKINASLMMYFAYRLKDETI